MQKTTEETEEGRRGEGERKARKESLIKLLLFLSLHLDLVRQLIYHELTRVNEDLFPREGQRERGKARGNTERSQRERGEGGQRE